MNLHNGINFSLICNNKEEMVYSKYNREYNCDFVLLFNSHSNSEYYVPKYLLRENVWNFNREGMNNITIRRRFNTK